MMKERAEKRAKEAVGVARRIARDVQVEVDKALVRLEKSEAGRVLDRLAEKAKAAEESLANRTSNASLAKIGRNVLKRAQEMRESLAKAAAAAAGDVKAAAVEQADAARDAIAEAASTTGTAPQARAKTKRAKATPSTTAAGARKASPRKKKSDSGRANHHGH